MVFWSLLTKFSTTLQKSNFRYDAMIDLLQQKIVWWCKIFQIINILQKTQQNNSYFAYFTKNKRWMQIKYVFKFQLFRIICQFEELCQNYVQFWRIQKFQTKSFSKYRIGHMLFFKIDDVYCVESIFRFTLKNLNIFHFFLKFLSSN